MANDGLLSIAEDPQRAGLLSLGLRLLATPGPFGRALGTSGLGAVSDMQTAIAARALAAQQRRRDQLVEMEMEQKRREQQRQQQEMERRAAVEAAITGSFRSPAQQALAGGGGPTPANAQAMEGLQPAIDQKALLSALMQADPMQAYQMMLPKPSDYKVVDGSLVSIGPTGKVTEAYRAPPKAQPIDYNQLMIPGPDGKPMLNTALFDARQRLAAAGRTTVSQTNVTGDRVPVPLIKLQDELIEKLTIARSTDADLGALQSKIDKGELNFGPVANLANAARNEAGMSTPGSRAYATFKSTLEKLRNDSLRLNTGVQTEGDAQRAWNELFASLNDTNLVNQRLTEIRKLNQRAAQLQEYRIGVLRKNSGASDLPDLPVAPVITAPGGSADELVKKYLGGG